MNGRHVTDAQISAALRAYLPDRAQAGLHERVADAVAVTTQQRPLPTFLAAFSQADPIARRRSLLVAAALMAALAIAGAALVGGLLRERQPNDLSLEAPADLPLFVRSAYEQMPELPPLALTMLEDGSIKGRVYVGDSGAVRIERYGSPDEREPETYQIYRGNALGEVRLAGTQRVWEFREGAISEDPRVFVYAALGAGIFGIGVEPGCELAISPGEVYEHTPASGWLYSGLEYVVERPAHHVACAGRDLWIDIETRLVLRSQGPMLDDAGGVVAGEFHTIEVTEITFGPQPAALFELEPPPGVAAITEEQQCALDPFCSATPVPAFTPKPGQTPSVLPPPPVNLASNGWVAYVEFKGIDGSGPADIYLARDGVEPHVIVGGDFMHGHNTCPRFSPDGSRLAYAEGTERRSDGTWGTQAVIIIGVDENGLQVGSDLRIPVPGPGYSGLPCPQWSPDGRSVAYLMTGETGYVSIAVTQLDGSTHLLASDDAQGSVAGRFIANWGAFAWSPGGDVIAATEGAGGLWLVPTDGGDPLLLREGHFGRPAWSPDGTRIAISTCSNQCEFFAISVLRVDGTTADVDFGRGESPAWSPNGNEIAFVGDGLKIVHPDGSNAHTLPYVGDPPGPEPWALASGVIWSPDGRHLLYIGYTDVGGYFYAPVSISTSGDAEPVVLAPPTFDLYAAHEWDLSWQPVLP